MLRDTAVGSPPLTRGKRQIKHISRDFAGITPAHAGKTLPASQPERQRKDHPRSRGENLSNASKPVRRIRITPAHAGKTLKKPLKKAFLRNQKLKFHLVLNTPDIEFCSPPLHDVVYYTLIQNTAQVFLI